VLVSHDRHLLRATTDQFLLVADGKLEPFDGDLDDYRDWLFRTKLGATVPLEVEPEAAPAPIPAPAVPVAPADRREQKRREAAERQRLSAARKPIESRSKRVEEQMAKLNARKSELEAQLNQSDIHAESNREKLKTLILDQAYVERELSQLEAEWLDLQEQLDQLEAAT
jgi:ATP-binding cassette subfamily F protein 3